MKQNIAVMLE